MKIRPFPQLENIYPVAIPFPNNSHLISANIYAVKTHYQQRMNLLWQALKSHPRPIYDLVVEIFPNMPRNDIFLAISDIVAHLEILINAGRVRIIDFGPPALYQSQN